MDDATRETESRWIARTRDGDRAAFTALMTRYLDDVTRVAFYMTHSRDAADDIAQRVWIWLWDHRAELDPDRPLKPYLLRAVRNRALDERKADAVRERYRDDVQAGALAGSVRAVVPSPEGAILTVATVVAAIDQLAESRRLALRLRLLDGMEHAEIAEILGISSAAARQLVHRGLADLQKMLGVSH